MKADLRHSPAACQGGIRRQRNPVAASARKTPPDGSGGALASRGKTYFRGIPYLEGNLPGYRFLCGASHDRFNPPQKLRSEERSEGNECVSTCRSWVSPSNEKK